MSTFFSLRKLLEIAIVVVASLSAMPVLASTTSLFNTIEQRTDSLNDLPQWQRVLSKIGREQASYYACAQDVRQCGSRAVRAWLEMIEKLRGADQAEQLHVANRFINQWHYRTDSKNYGTSDYWASPNEFFKRSGDCEDYAIAKYVTLRLMGYSADQLRMVVVNDLRRDVPHAVLAAYVDGRIFILDNLTNQVRAQSKVAEYVPYYSVNEKARWTHAAAPASSEVASATDIEAAPSSALDGESLVSRS